MDVLFENSGFGDEKYRRLVDTKLALSSSQKLISNYFRYSRNLKEQIYLAIYHFDRSPAAFKIGGIDQLTDYLS